VQKFVKKSDRSDPKQTVKSVYCKHFPKEWTEADLSRKMNELGVSQEEIQSVWICIAQAESGNFGIVTFTTHESAARVIAANETSKQSYVQVGGREGEPKKNAWFKTCLLLRKADRQRELAAQTDKRRLETMQRKIYVINLELTATEESVRKFFSEFGEVVRVQFYLAPDQKHNGRCYVIFTSIESAQQALSATGRVFGNNKISVKPFKNQQMRQKNMEFQQQQRNFGYNMPYGNNGMFPNRAGAGPFRNQGFRQGAPYPNNQYMYPVPQYGSVPYQQQPQQFRQQMGNPNRVAVGRMDNKMGQPRYAPNNQRPQ